MAADGIISIVAGFIVCCSIFFAFLSHFDPRRKLLLDALKISGRYGRLTAKEGADEKEAWKKTAAEYFASAGGSPLEREKSVAAAESAWKDYVSRQDIIRSRKAAAGELARRLLLLRYGKAGSPALAKTEEIYKAVETALKLFK